MSLESFFRFLEKLGFNPTRWRWRWMRWKNRLDQKRESAQKAKNYAIYKHKICDECGALMDGSERSCPRCGFRAPSWSGQFVRRIFGIVLPSWGIFSSLILLANLAVVQAGIIKYGFAHITSPTSESLVRLGGLFPPLFNAGEYWRLITYGYLHIGLAHLLFNLIALIQVGPFLEREVGSARFFSVYTLSMIGGGIADLWFRQKIFLVAGASGALFGLIGFGIAYNHFLGGPTAQARRNFFTHWAAYGFIFGYFVGADNIAHLGGLIVGAVLGVWMEKEGMRRRAWSPFWKAVCSLCIVATVLSFVGMIWELSLPLGWF